MNLEDLKSSVFVGLKAMIAFIGIRFAYKKIRRFMARRKKDKLFPLNKRKGPVKNLSEESSTWCLACCLILASLFLNGCATKGGWPCWAWQKNTDQKEQAEAKGLQYPGQQNQRNK